MEEKLKIDTVVFQQFSQKFELWCVKKSIEEDRKIFQSPDTIQTLYSCDKVSSTFSYF
jgi:hypothetical protein